VVERLTIGKVQKHKQNASETTDLMWRYLTP